MRLPSYLRSSAFICGSLLSLCASVTFAQDAAPAKPVAVRDPIARDLLATNPTTPREIMNVINLLVDLREPQAAVPLLQKLEAASLDEAALAALHEEFGTSVLLKLSTDPVLKAASAKLVESILAAADKQARDPQHLADLIEKLKSPAPGSRTKAMAALTRGRDAAVAALMEVLKDPAREAEFAHVRDALAMLGGESVGALGAVLDGSDEALSKQAVAVLTRLSHPDAELHLLTAAFSPHSPPAVREAATQALPPSETAAVAVATLRMRAMKLYAQQSPLDVRANGQVPVWTWNAEKKQVQLAGLSPPAASFALAARFAARAKSIVPGDLELRRLYLASVLEGAALESGFDKPLSSEAGKAIENTIQREGVGALNDLLAESLKRDKPVVATLAARILGDVGTAALLRTPDSRLSPLAQAARSGDRRVRFAATEAIIRLDPQGPFPGDSYVGESIEFFVKSRGLPRALAGDIYAADAQSMAGLLMSAGFEANSAAGHHPFLRAAVSSPDYELFVIDYVQASINSAQLLSDLRHDNRTAAVPIVVVADAADLNLASTLAFRQPRVMVVERPYGANGLQQTLLSCGVGEELVEAARVKNAKEFKAKAMQNSDVDRLVPRGMRLKQAVAAINWAIKSGVASAVLASRRSFDPVLEDALFQPELRAAAMALLVERGKASGQRALVELASRGTESVEVRQVAAQAFADSVQRHTTLLTTTEIALQYERYNASESQPKEVHAILGTILDAIEARAAKASLPVVSKKQR